MATNTMQDIHLDALDADGVPLDTFGCRLAQIRQAMGWNVEEAASACGLVGQTWRNWEAGTTPRNVLVIADQIAVRTGCNARWIVWGQNWKFHAGPHLQLVQDDDATITEPTGRGVLRSVQ